MVGSGEPVEDEPPTHDPQAGVTMAKVTSASARRRELRATVRAAVRAVRAAVRAVTEPKSR